MYVIGLDIGGANLKVADCDGRARAVPFALWKTPELLAGTLRELVADFGRPELIAVTMTGELADCFETKSEGVDQILTAVEEAVAAPVLVWSTGAEFITTDIAREFPLLAAAANWHALATWVGRMVSEQRGLLIDIGSTTTDIIPLEQGFPVPEGLTDVERLLAGELVYTGGKRTPLAMISQSVPLRGQMCPLAAESFATTLDLYLLLGMRQEDALDLETANGKPATRKAARVRLARSVCCDTMELSESELLVMAEWLASQQLEQLKQAVDRVLDRSGEPVGAVLISGSAVFLAEKLVRSHPILSQVSLTDLAEIFDATIADAACAFAVSRLAVERVQIKG